MHLRARAQEPRYRDSLRRAAGRQRGGDASARDKYAYSNIIGPSIACTQTRRTAKMRTHAPTVDVAPRSSQLLIMIMFIAIIIIIVITTSIISINIIYLPRCWGRGELKSAPASADPRGSAACRQMVDWGPRREAPPPEVRLNRFIEFRPQ